MAEAVVPIVPGRQCGSCTMCCKVMRIDEIGKPAGLWCAQCDVGKGCRIYETRPGECRGFHCAFLRIAELGEAWRPSQSRIVLAVELDGKRLAAYVDHDRPEAWRREPFYSTLKGWAAMVPANERQIVVFIDRRAIVILPEGDVDLGTIADDEAIVTEVRAGPNGAVASAIKVKQDDPRAAQA